MSIRDLKIKKARPALNSKEEAEAYNQDQQYADNPKLVKPTGELDDVVKNFRANRIVNDMLTCLAAEDDRSVAYIARTHLEPALRKEITERGLEHKLAQVQSSRKI